MAGIHSINIYPGSKKPLLRKLNLFTEVHGTYGFQFGPKLNESQY